MHVRSAVVGLGTALPPYRIPQAAAADLVARSVAARGGSEALVRRVFRGAGVESRRTVLEGIARGEVPFAGRSRGTAARMAAFREHAAPLAARSCSAALEGSGVAPAEVTHLVVVTCTGFYAPGPDADLVGLLGLSPGVDRTLVGFMGCHGAFAGLRVARRAVEADPRAVALVACVELCSLHLRDDPAPGSVVAHALFGDGAAAAVVAAPRRGESLFDLGPAAVSLSRESGSMMGWEIGDDGFEMTLSSDVPTRLAAEISAFAAPLLPSGASGARASAWCLHPGGPAILAAAGRALGMCEDDLALSRSVLRDPGNVSSASILFVMERALAAMAPGARGLALGFGPGLTIEGFAFARGSRAAAATEPESTRAVLVP